MPGLEDGFRTCGLFSNSLLPQVRARSLEFYRYDDRCGRTALRPLLVPIRHEVCVRSAVLEFAVVRERRRRWRAC